MLLTYGEQWEEKFFPNVRHTSSLSDLVDNVDSWNPEREGCTVFVSSTEDVKRVSWVRTALGAPLEVVRLPGTKSRRFIVFFLVANVVNPKYHGALSGAVYVVNSVVESHFVLSSVMHLSKPTPSLKMMFYSLLPKTLFEINVNSGKIFKAVHANWVSPYDGLSVELGSGSKSIQEILDFNRAKNHVTLSASDQDMGSQQIKAKRWLEASWIICPISEIDKKLNADFRPRVCSSCGNYMSQYRCQRCGAFEGRNAA